MVMEFFGPEILFAEEIETGEQETETSFSETEMTEGTEYAETESITTDPEEKPKADLLTIGIIAGVAVVAALLVLALLLRKKRGKKKETETPQTAQTVQTGDEMEGQKTISPAAMAGDTVKRMDLSDRCIVNGGSVHGIGRRSSQQDSFGFAEKEGEFLAVVADGMGGLAEGDRVSQQVVVTMLSGFDRSSGDIAPDVLLYDLVDQAASVVNEDLGPDKIGRCGSTLVTVYIRGNLLYFISVGDSHIYVWRDGNTYQLNQDHNYAAVLDERARRGEISEEEAMRDPQRAALTSYIGMGELELIDQNLDALPLLPGDRILLMSDGIFGTVSDTELGQILTLNLEESCRALDMAVQSANRSNQDNYTCILLEVKQTAETP